MLENKFIKLFTRQKVFLGLDALFKYTGSLFSSVVSGQGEIGA